jgi:parvulin-like peptidyl-prolyl isomerase
MAKPSSTTPKITTKKHIARLERERRQVALIKTISITAIVIAVLLVGYGILDTTYLRFRKPVAEVNGETISLGYWQERVQYSRLNLANNLQQYQYYQQNFGMDLSQQIQQIQGLLQIPETLGDQVLTQLIDEALIRQEAEKRGITVTSAEIEKSVQESPNFGFFADGTPTPTVTPTEFSYPTLTNQQLTLYPSTATATPFLTPTPGPTNTPDPAVTSTSTPGAATPTALPLPATATSTPYTLDGYKDQYSKSLTTLKGFGISESTLRSVYENQLYREKLLAVITKDTPHTEEQILARHILVDDPQLAGAVYALLKDGQDFAELAKKYSKDTGSGAGGGYLGWATKSTYVPEFGDAAFSQKIGEIGKPVKTQYGYHIIQVMDRKDLPITDSQYEQNRQKAFTDWVTKTTDDAKTAGKLTTFDDTWKANIPATPDSISQLLQQ